MRLEVAWSTLRPLSVRFEGQSGNLVLDPSLSGVDPQRTFAFKLWAFRTVHCQLSVLQWIDPSLGA
jgi:hypothetical protein